MLSLHPPASARHRGRTQLDQHRGKKTLGDLLAVMTALRHPETGCPWDQQQTFQTIAPYTIEEAYEVADAIERGNLVDLRKELGDLLLQVVYHAEIARELKAFDFSEVASAITEKMIRRHPHVFGDESTRKAGVTEGFWERIKAEERTEKAAHHAASGTPAQSTPSASLLDDVPAALPALSRAVKLQSKAARVGFDWPDLAPVIAKMREELNELDEAVSSGDHSAIEDEFGDLLFVMANVARHLKIDPEASLRGTNAKFARRFRQIETWLSEQGRTPQQSNLEEMDALWDRAKLEEKSR